MRRRLTATTVNPVVIKDYGSCKKNGIVKYAIWIKKGEAHKEEESDNILHEKKI
jgi:hypothetical protein